MTELRVAICVSGLPRFHWRACLPWWTTLFADHGKVEFDVFAHLWDYDIPLYKYEAPPTPFPRDELDELVNRLSPKAFMIESANVQPIKLINYSGPIKRAEWAARASQAYGCLHAMMMKRRYEQEHDFVYDVCVRARTDMLPNTSAFPSSPLPIPGKIFSSPVAGLPAQAGTRMSDIFYYGNSEDFNLASCYFNHIHEFFNPVNDYAELRLSQYVASTGLEPTPLDYGVKLRRFRREVIPPNRTIWPWEEIVD